MIDPEALRVAMCSLLVLVAGIDLGIAFVIRAAREASGSDPHD